MLTVNNTGDQVSRPASRYQRQQRQCHQYGHDSSERHAGQRRQRHPGGHTSTWTTPAYSRDWHRRIGAVEVFDNATIKNSGTIVSNVDNTFAIKSDSGALDVNNLSGGLIQANGANGFAINAATNATVANAGRIEATGAGGIAIMGTLATRLDRQRRQFVVSHGQ